MTFKIITLLVVFLLHVTSLCNGLRQSQLEHVKMVMLLEGQFSSNENNTEYQCYISNSDGSTGVESFRQINTRRPFNIQEVSGSNNPAPPDAVPVDGSNTQWRVNLDEENNNDFGVFGCRATQAGRRETEILGVFMRSDAEIIPKDELFTKTVSDGETGVSIDVEVLRPPPPRGDGIILFIRWLKNNSRNDALNGMNSWPIAGPVRVDDAGVYECHYDRRRCAAFQGLQLLIVRACASGRWGPPDCFGICDNCYNGGICDDKTGRCICAPGFMGPNCLTGCGSNKFGYQCEFTCATGNTENGCQGKQFCLVNPFGCRCNTGYQDLSCSDECEDGKFGAGCLQDCHCQNQDSCNRFTGHCDAMGCEAPWSGQNCQIPAVCPDGYYGSECTLKCLCMDNDACARSTGQCSNQQCAPGSKQNGGLNCEACDEGFFGDSCSGECHCTPDACDIVTGECDGCCLPQWADSSSCQEGISGFDVVKVNPGAESMITCQWIVRSTNMQTYQFQLSRSQERLDEDGVSAMSPIASPFCSSILCSGSRSFTIGSAQPNDQFYCLLLDGSNQIVAWLNTSSITFVLPVLMEPPEVIFRNQSSVTIQWKPWNQQSDIGDPAIVGYVTYYRETSETAIWMPSDNVTDNEMLQFTYSSLLQDTNYEFSVAAGREGINGLGSMSPSVTNRTLCNKPTAMPSSVLVESLDMAARLNISWKVEGSIGNCSTGITSYIIYFNLENSNDEPQMLVTSSDTWIIVSEDDGLQPGQRYTFSVSLVTDQESDLSQPSEPVTLQQEEDPEPPGALWILLILIPIILIAFLLTGWYLYKRKSKKKPAAETQYNNKVIDVSDEANDYTGLNNETKSVTSKYKHIKITRDNSVAYEVGTENTNSLKDGNSEYETVESKHRDLPKKPKSAFRKSEASRDEDYEIPDDIKQYAGVYINEPKTSDVKATPSPIKVSEFQDFMRRDRKIVIEKIVKEFMIFFKGTQSASLPEVQNKMGTSNTSLNESDLYYNSRVKLNVPRNVRETAENYNAHMIKGSQNNTTFIAAQGPSNKSMAVEFWKMAWQENVKTIVMLTDSLDSASCYWPKNVAVNQIFDDMTVVCQKVTSYASCYVRKMRILKVDDDDKHLTVHQYHFKHWPRGGVPSDSLELIEFIHQVKKAADKDKNTPLLVHCSDGRGATGTFIAIYRLMSTLKESKRISVFDEVKKLRKDRMDLVQTRVQYLFIYDTLQIAHLTPENWQCSLEEVKCMDNLSLEKKGEREFIAITKIQRLSQKVECLVGMAPENAHKNRFPSIIPVDRYRPILKSEGTTYGSNDYINATILTNDDGTVILTQAPLTSILEDFWRLVYDYKCGRIIMLNETKKSDKVAVKYWPDAGSFPVGSMNVKCVRTKERGCMTQRRFVVTHHNSSESVSVDQFVFDGPIDGDDVSNLRDFILATKTGKYDTTVVHCQNGVSLSAVYVVVKAQINCLDREGRCDVFSAVQQLKKRNPNMILTKDDYILCLKLLRCYVNEENEYSVIQ